MKRFFTNTIHKTALYYTITIALFSFIVLLSNSSDSSVSLDPARILLFLPFCFSFAIANTMLQYPNIEAITRWGVHFALTVIGAFLFVILPAELESSSGNFIGLIAIIALYIIGIIIYNLFSIRIKKTITQDKQLKEQSKKHK